MSAGNRTMPDIKAIETQYKGYRFRSRLEARWAVFFDTLGLKWEYEPEGFKIDGECYLPDFYLPDNKSYIEIKPAWPTKEERTKIGKFADYQTDHNNNFTYLFRGLPETFKENNNGGTCFLYYDKKIYDTTQIDAPYASIPDTDLTLWSRYHHWSECPNCGKIYVQGLRGYMSWLQEYKTDHPDAGVICPRCKFYLSFITYEQQCFTKRLEFAINSARAARFEHGEKGI